ncbi:MAG: hypothetical protein IIY94_05410 [Oscillospiraceae bacterium]|nr:hypothetical protein [Oscillospiraceae bacterium]
MKKATFLLLSIFALLLAGCEKASEGNARTSEDTTAAPYVLQTDPADRSQSLRTVGFVETGEGCYYVGSKTMSSGGGRGKFIFFCPRGENNWYILCSKPECKHKDENCNAYAGSGWFGYYDGALYTINDALDCFHVVKRNLDGTDHQIVATVDLKQRGGYEGAFHHGRFLLRTANDGLEGAENLPDYLIAVDLADDSQTEPLAEYLQTEKLPLDTRRFYKDKVYGWGLEADPTMTELDLASGAVKKRDIGYITGLYATDSTLYYYLPEESEVDGKKLEAGFWEYDLESKTAKYCGLPVEGATCATYDEDYIYADTLSNLDESRMIYILSRDYQVLDQIELDGDSDLAAATSDRLYFECYSPQIMVRYYLDKSQIGSGSLQLIPMDVVG